MSCLTRMHSSRPKVLPFGAWWPVAAGALTGIAFRLVFSGAPGGIYSAMLGSFVYLVPAVVGVVTIVLAERSARRTWTYYFWAPALANVLFVAGTMAILIEGLICAVLIVPVFTLLGGVAGLITGAVCRRIGSAQHMLIGVAVLPLMLAPLESGVSLPKRVGVVERTVLVGASAPDVWSRIVNTGPIAAERVGGAWMFRIGVPVPLAGTTRETPQGFVRRVTMAKNVYFDELITDWRPPHRLRWVYRFYEDSFPPTALDDHVRLGGEYFDMLDTSYSLAETDAGTQVKVRMTYRVSTRFNWYADPLARFLLGNMAEGNLRYYASPADSPEG